MAGHPKLVQRPVPGPKAFAGRDWRSVTSQAAILLAFGREIHVLRRSLAPWLKSEGARLAAAPPDLLTATALVGHTALEQEQEAFSSDDFPVPILRDTPEAASRMLAFTSADRLEALTGGPIGERAAPPSNAELTALAEQTYTDPRVQNASALIHRSLGHEEELVRVAAAVAAFPTTAQTAPLLRILEKGTKSRNAVTKELAIHALGVVDPANPLLQKLLKPKRRRGGPPSQTTLLVHGTFARTGVWWQLGGDFHKYILENVRPDIYAAVDRYDWTGAYSDAARDLAAEELVAWFQDRPGNHKPSIIAHSHGGSVAMLATRRGLELDTLVLLSCPVHRDKYLPDFNRVRRVVSIRVRNDYVILLDGGRQVFNHPNIEELTLPIWFDHSATRYPKSWIDNDVARRLRLILQ